MSVKIQSWVSVTVIMNKTQNTNITNFNTKADYQMHRKELKLKCCSFRRHSKRSNSENNNCYQKREMKTGIPGKCNFSKGAVFRSSWFESSITMNTRKKLPLPQVAPLVSPAKSRKLRARCKLSRCWNTESLTAHFRFIKIFARLSAKSLSLVLFSLY